MATLSQGVESMVRLLQGRRGKGERITIETIQAVNGNGRYTVRGVACPASGTAQLKVGDRVAVAWRGAKPYLIIAHQSRRAQFGPYPSGGGGVVEELFIAGIAGAREVYFRNLDQIASLLIRSRLDADPAWVRWATRSDAFVVGTAEHHYYIFKLDRTQNLVLGRNTPTATLHHHEKPLEAGIVLCAARHHSHTAGETRYFTFIPPDTQPKTVSEHHTIPIVYDSDQDGVIKLTKDLIEGNPAARGLITDIQVNDKLDLIFILSVSLGNKAVIDPPAPTVSDDHLVEKFDGTGQVADGEFDVAVSAGVFGAHVFVVNTTTGAMLFRTASAALKDLTTVEMHRFSTFYGWPSGTTITDAPGAAPAELTYDDIQVGPTYQLGSISSYTWEEYNEATLPYLDFGALFGTDHIAATAYALPYGPWTVHDPGSFANGVRVNAFKNKTWRKNSYEFSATYLPRRATAVDADGVPTALPLGWVLLKVMQTTWASSSDLFGTRRAGFFLHDLAPGGAVTAIAPMAANFFSGQGIILPGNSFAHIGPETEGFFVVVGFNGRHLLWFHRHKDTADGAMVADLKLTDVTTGITALVFSASIDEVGGDLIISADMLVVLELNLQTLRPDFMYDPDLLNGGIKAAFLDAWSKPSGAPTLSAVGDTLPEDPALVGLGVLLGLPEDLIETEPGTITHDGGPVNEVATQETGPSYHVVNDAGILGTTGRFQDDV